MPDGIALGAWGVEWHDRATLQSSFVYPPDKLAYEIPLRCLVSRDTANLFAAGRVVDADRQAGASLRVMGTAFATGQAAGVAAAMLADQGKTDSDRVRQILREQGALIDANRSHRDLDRGRPARLVIMSGRDARGPNMSGFTLAKSVAGNGSPTRVTRNGCESGTR